MLHQNSRNKGEMMKLLVTHFSTVHLWRTHPHQKNNSTINIGYQKCFLITIKNYKVQGRGSSQ